MAYLPDISETMTSRVVTDTFMGYDHNLRQNDGAWYDEENLTSAVYPVFSQRGKRATVANNASAVRGIACKDALAYVAGTTLYYNGTAVYTGLAAGDKQLVSMGAYLCVFPDAVYVNTKNLTDKGAMGAKFQTQTGGAQVSFSMVALGEDNFEFDSATVSSTAPKDPANGDTWIDTGSAPHALKVYSSSQLQWVQITSTYVRITCTGIGAMFAENDGVTISGIVCTSPDTELKAQIEGLNADSILYAVSDNWIQVPGIIDEMYTEAACSIVVERKVPKMDYVCELNNRLWGCKYGFVDGQTVNEIYACALGDPKNWFRYAGISTDSYAVSVGSDGAWTGIVAHGGYVLAFKEGCMHKIYGTMPSNYQVSSIQCRGVQRGSERSLVVVNEVLYYKSTTDVCAYTGSMPQSVSYALAGQKFKNARAGAVGGRYYICMQDEQNAWRLFVYDTEKQLWHKEDGFQIGGFARMDDDLIAINSENNAIVSMLGLHGTKDADEVEWFAESGIIGFEYPDQKYLSRFNIRMWGQTNTRVEVLCEYDSSGVWESQGEVQGMSLQTVMIPVIPRRCDHMRIKLIGTGEIRIYSIAKILEVGSDCNGEHA